jgi:uncharacterized protein (DUF302 family)
MDALARLLTSHCAGVSRRDHATASNRQACFFVARGMVSITLILRLFSALLIDNGSIALRDHGNVSRAVQVCSMVGAQARRRRVCMPLHWEPRIMTHDTTADRTYGFEQRLEHTTVAEALERVTAALKSEGFGILTQIDVRDTLKKKIDVDFRSYLILGACNPSLAYRALTLDAQIGLLLPCNVVIQEAVDGAVVVSIADPRVMFTVVDNPALAPIVDEAEQRLRRVAASLA